MTIAIVKQNRQIADGIYLLTLYAPMVSDASRPGQFLNVYLWGDDLILPRPISIAGAGGGEVSLIYATVGKGTRRMTFLSEGDDVRVLGPLGNAFDIDNLSAIYDEVVCVGGGLGIPSMDYAARHFEKRIITNIARHCEDRTMPNIPRHCEEPCDVAIRCSTIFGYRDDAWLPQHHRTRAVAISEHDKSVSGEHGIIGNVIDLLNIHEFTGKTPIILSCGPVPMLKAVQDFAEARNIKTKLSLEARMGCGYGACVGCVISLKDGARRKVCMDGPIFDGETIIWESLE